jgi:hypothetical protein
MCVGVVVEAGAVYASSDVDVGDLLGWESVERPAGVRAEVSFVRVEVGDVDQEEDAGAIDDAA